MERKIIHKANKKQKETTAIDYNLFDDCFFWLSLAAADFHFVLFENNKEPVDPPDTGSDVL